MTRKLTLLLPFLLLAACTARTYYLLSPEDDYSDDPAVGFRLVSLQSAGRPEETTVVLEVENRTNEQLMLADARFQMVDADEKHFDPVANPDTTVAPGKVETVELKFPTADASKGTFELRVENLPVKIWPIIFTDEKPPDFKATPEPQNPQGPQRPPGPY